MCSKQIKPNDRNFCIHLAFRTEGIPLVIMCQVSLVTERKLKKIQTGSLHTRKKYLAKIKLLHKHRGHCLFFFYKKCTYIWIKVT